MQLNSSYLTESGSYCKAASSTAEYIELCWSCLSYRYTSTKSFTLTALFLLIRLLLLSSLSDVRPLTLAYEKLSFLRAYCSTGFDCFPRSGCFCTAPMKCQSSCTNLCITGLPLILTLLPPPFLRIPLVFVSLIVCDLFSPNLS